MLLPRSDKSCVDGSCAGEERGDGSCEGEEGGDGSCAGEGSADNRCVDLCFDVEKQLHSNKKSQKINSCN